MMLFFFSAFLLISLKGEIAWQGLALSVIVPALIYVATMWLPRFFPADKLLLSIANFLCALGVLILYSTDLDGGTSRGMQQAMYYGVGIVVMLGCIMLVRYVRRWSFLIYVVMGGAVLLLALPLAIGTEQYGATNWIRVGGMSLQPSEVVKLALLLILSYFMSHRRLIPWLAFCLYCLGVLMLQKDLGTALIYYFTALFMYYAYTGNLLMTGVGLLGAAGASVLGYQMFAHVKKRVAIWQNPWMYYETSGYQIVQMLMAIASGGLFGTGLGQGHPYLTPFANSDYIYASLGEEFGLVGCFGILLLYIIIIASGFITAMKVKDGFGKLLSSGLVFTMAFQVFTVVGGITLVIPLTGLTLPYMAAGGSSMVANYLLATLLIIISNAANKPAPETLSETFQHEALAALRDRELKEREAERASKTARRAKGGAQS